MTKQEFAAVKAKLSPKQRESWNGFLPLCDEETFFNELKRPDGMIEVLFVDPGLGPKLWFV